MPLSSWLRRTAGALTLAAMAGLAAPASAQSITVGAPVPQTGPFASDGVVMERAIRLAIDDLNAAGGVLGRDVEMLTFDIGDLTPDKLQAAAVNLVDRNGADMIVTGYGGFGPDIPAFCPTGVPFLHADAFTSVVDLMNNMGCTNIFNISDVEAAYGRAIFAQLSAVGHEFPNKKLAIVHGPFEWESGLTGAMAEAAEAAGWEVVVQEEVPFESVQWQPILSRIRSEQPSLIHIEVLDPSLTNTFIQQYRENPVPGALINAGYAASIPAFGEVIASGDADGVLGMTLSAHRPGPEGEAFAAKWRAAFDEEAPMSIAALLYDGVLMWAEAVEQVGDPSDHAAINQALLDARYEGLTGVLDINERFMIPTSDESQPSFLFQVRDRQLQTVMLGSQKLDDIVTPEWAQ